jgi:hypothetical protein
MKKSFAILSILAIIISLVNFSCDNSEDDNSNKRNQIEYNGEIYELTWGEVSLDDDLPDDNKQDFSIVLYSESLRSDMDGVGHDFGIEGLSASTNIAGTYTVVSVDNNDDETAGLAECQLDVYTEPLDEYHEGDIFEFVEGSLSINIDNLTYEISFSGKDLAGNSCTLYYKGELEID